ncbi:unnamed protein product [Prorocentrum cordatum]|uniref:Secreted protein n=1 Tax=Prorocentrum cordatum TaxID=2364126 RepID=A0ABN9UXS5_9DINO|nr:unnamed protein product [Polarella glacialis]|mmetsp:Transcript_90116/g.234614  ORF Transcript_90116/g.234614 Transcript_90116/m.234614 type:complete len:515 (-) Transcript_90116:338-1882(-)
MPTAASALALTALLAVQARGDGIDYVVTEYPEVTVNSGGSSDVATVVLSETAGIVCYADWAGDKDGWCNALDLSVASAPVDGPDEQLAGVKLRHFTLARFSETQAVVCYVRLGSDGMGVCRVLQVESDWSLTVGDDMIIDSDTIYLHQLDVASFSQTSGVVCYADTDSEPNLKVLCVPFALDPTSLDLTRGQEIGVDDYVHHVQQVIVTTFSDTSAVVCYALEDSRIDELEEDFPDGDVAWCSPIFFNGTALSYNGGYATVNLDATYDLAVARLTDDYGVLCFTDGGDDYGKCRPLSFDSGAIALGEVLQVSVDTTSNLTLAPLSPTAAMVCFMAGSSQTGKCSGLVMSHGTELAMGDDIDIDSGAFVGVEDCAKGWEEECGLFMSVSAYASPLNMNGLACYAGLGGDEGVRCSILEVPPPTTTETGTSTTGTSSTTPHTTTESSSTTATTTATSFTRTTKTTTETLTSTTPHTTTETSTTEAPAEVVNSGAVEGAAVRQLAATAALVSVAALL